MGSADKNHVEPEGAANDSVATKPARRKPIRIEDLPQPGITRWVIRRKAQVVAAVQSGAISLEEVCRRYSVSLEEFQSWQRSLEQHGIYGLRTTRSQIYRSSANDDETRNKRR
jgi:transposase-like protein